MKATLKTMLPGYTGNMDDLVIYYNSKLNKMIARRKVIPKPSVSTQAPKLIFAFSRRIVISKAWKEDCNRYIRAYNAKFRRKGKAHSSWPSVWMKLMYAQMQDRPDLDFTTLTRDDAIAHQLPCRSIATSVEAGYLDKVDGWDSMIAEI